MVCKCDQLPHLCCKSEVANSIDVHSQYQLQTKRDIHVNPLCGAEVGHMVCSSLGTNQPMKTRLQSCQLIQGRVKQLQVSHSDPEDTVWSSLSSLKSEDSVETGVKSCSHSRVDSLTSVCLTSLFSSHFFRLWTWRRGCWRPVKHSWPSSGRHRGDALQTHKDPHTDTPAWQTALSASSRTRDVICSVKKSSSDQWEHRIRLTDLW